MVTFCTHGACTHFGLAKETTGSSVHTRRACTLHYMSPEMLYNQDYDKPHDVWSMGVVFVEMTTGELTFLGADARELRENIRHLFSFKPVKEHMNGNGDPIPVSRNDMQSICQGELDKLAVVNHWFLRRDAGNAADRVINTIATSTLTLEPSRRITASVLRNLACSLDTLFPSASRIGATAESREMRPAVQAGLCRGCCSRGSQRR